jgi:nitric oxide reductase NorE protein
MEYQDHKNIFNPPGGVLIWFVILMELVTFSAGIFFYFSYREDNLALFLEMQKKLNLHFAITNTLFLITSGYFVAMSLNYLKMFDRIKSRLFLLIGIAFGFCFIFLKSFEYYEKISQGYTTSYNDFFTFYWFLTFFHYMHVVFTTFILIFLYFKLKIVEEGEVNALEVGAALWHMCDLIWIILFPTLFLIR